MKRLAIFSLLLITISSGAFARGADQPIVPSGFTIERIATIDSARELAAAPNGDLFVGTLGNDVYFVAHADSTKPDDAKVFAHFDNSPAAGVALGKNQLYVGTQFAVYAIPYHVGERAARAAPVRLASVRTSGIARDHVTTTVAIDGESLFASVGSSCNACKPDLDDTRATIQRIDLRTGRMTAIATHIRNAIALAVNLSTGTLWAGVAGVDDLPVGHPYEILDAVTPHALPIDYGWPSCYENRQANPQWPGDCSKTAIPRVVLPAYETPIGAVFYPATQHGPFAFPERFRGGIFATLHGSWHGPSNGLSGYVPPRVVFVPMHGDDPERRVNWRDPSTQWTQFIGGYQVGGTIERIGRPTGIAVGPDGSLFVADDLSGAIYRIRPKR